MNDKSGNPKKPLRNTANYAKDLYNTYVRNEGSRSIPINTPESDKVSQEESVGEDLKMNDTETIQDVGIEEVTIGKDELKELIHSIENLQKEKDDLRDQLLRKGAEMENLRRRLQKEKDEMVFYANEKLLDKLLPILDDFHNAVEAGKNNNDYEALLTGLKLIYQKAMKTFEETGVTPIGSPVGKPFDVNMHEAIMHIASEVPEGYVVHQVQTGYMLHDKVLRHTKVVTSSGEPEGDGNEE